MIGIICAVGAKAVENNWTNAVLRELEHKIALMSRARTLQVQLQSEPLVDADQFQQILNRKFYSQV